MLKVEIDPPSGKRHLLDNVQWLKGKVLSYPDEYWFEGACGIALHAVRNDGKKVMMMVLPNIRSNRERGLHLKYIENAGPAEDTWLSVGDPTKLDVLTECADEWYVSLGLFLSPDVAWTGIEEFIQTGQRSRQLSWIQPSDLPKEGNF